VLLRTQSLCAFEKRFILILRHHEIGFPLVLGFHSVMLHIRHSRGHIYPPCLTVRRASTSARHVPRYTLAGDSQAKLPPGATENPGNRISQWFQSPFDVAAFGPRLVVGFLSKCAQPSNVVDELQRVTDLSQSPAPTQYKTNLVALELETCEFFRLCSASRRST
jgi:hypothetical protein